MNKKTQKKYASLSAMGRQYTERSNNRGVHISNLKIKAMNDQFDPGSCCDGDSGCCGGMTGCC